MSSRPTASRSSEQAVVIENVSKRFRLYRDRPTSLKQAFTRVARAARPEEFWAVRDVSLEIPKGCTYALVGHNGSGKSTLLRLISGIYRPTQGQITTNGRISALLELGAGFHPELTGRENVYLNGAILGLTRKEVRSKLDEIVEFSGLADFIDSPVKIYSSGMYVRLGFSIAVHANPQILIIDEIIAVGDEEFQRRCFDHLYSLRRRGATIVLVTHGHQLVEQICDEAALLDHGRLVTKGSARSVIGRYLDKVNFAEGERLADEASQHDLVVEGGRRGAGEITIDAVEYLDGRGQPVHAVRTGDAMTVRIHFTAHEATVDPVFGMALHHDSGTHLAGWNSRQAQLATGMVEGRGFVDYTIDAVPFVPGKYFFTTAVYDARILHPFDVRDKAFPLHIQPVPGSEAHGLFELGGRWALSSSTPSRVSTPQSEAPQVGEP